MSASRGGFTKETAQLPLANLILSYLSSSTIIPDLFIDIDHLDSSNSQLEIIHQQTVLHRTNESKFTTLAQLLLKLGLIFICNAPIEAQ